MQNGRKADGCTRSVALAAISRSGRSFQPRSPPLRKQQEGKERTCRSSSPRSKTSLRRRLLVLSEPPGRTCGEVGAIVEQRFGSPRDEHGDAISRRSEALETAFFHGELPDWRQTLCLGSYATGRPERTSGSTAAGRHQDGLSPVVSERLDRMRAAASHESRGNGSTANAPRMPSVIIF